MTPRQLAAQLLELAGQPRAELERDLLLQAVSLLEQQELFEQICTNLPDMIFVKDAENLCFVLFNPAGEKLLGIPFQELRGKSDYDFFPPAEADFFTEKDRQVLRGGQLLDIPEEPIATRLGERILHTKKIPILGSDGQPLYLLGISRDITEARIVQQRLREVVQTARVFVWEHDPECRITHVVGRLEEVMGYSSQELLGRYWWDLCHPQASDELRRWWLEGVMPQRQSFEGVETRLLDRQGRSVWVQCSGGPLWGARGDLLGYRGVAVDVSDRKLRELELAQTNERLHQAMAAAQQAAREAERANLAKSVFLASISHELRTPLNGVVGMAGLLAATPLSEDQADYVRTLQASADTLISIINDILDYSKIEAGGVDLERRSFDPRLPFEEATELLAPLAYEKGLEVRLDLSPSLPSRVLGDANRLRQVLVNLLGNAIKFTSQGEIEIQLAHELLAEEQVLLQCSVRDTGIGIPPDRLDRLFKPFSQVDISTTRRFGGTGLGLAICRRLVELMQGHIVVESHPGQGSAFYFNVQVAAAPACEETTLPPGRRVRLLETHPKSQRILLRQLESWGLQVTDEAPWDVLVAASDRLTPALRAQSPVVCLVAPGQAARAGGTASLTRPVRPTQLRQVLASLLSTTPRSAQATAPSPAPLPKLRILLAEDNQVNQKVARLMLAQLGQDCTIVDDGRAAVAAAAQLPYDLILMDIQMPEMDGLEATRRIMELQNAYVIALTAGASGEERERALSVGMRDFLSKPLQGVALREALERAVLALQAAGGRAANRLSP